MRKYLLIFVLPVFVFACKNKKTPQKEQHKEANEFFDAYGKLKLPFIVTDTSIGDIADTGTIAFNVFTRFIPDSIFNTPFGQDRKISLHPIGKIEQNGKETYFVTLAKSKNNAAVYLSVYDKNKFVTNMPLVSTNDDNKVTTAAIDKKLSININSEWTIKNNIFYRRAIYAYNNVGIFTTVLTETNEDRNAESAILNPLDTFPKRYKYSGDYANGAKNVLFIRDGKTAGEYLFFVHFQSEEKDEPCGGELKGRLKMVSDKAAVYTGNGDPCVLNLTFSLTAVKVKENGSCGNFRGIKCFFNDTYSKRKEPKTSSKKKNA